MITVHHLKFSRSTRVIWLMEELGLAYRLVTYDRDANFRAPEALKAVHPLGKAPVIQDGDLTLAESAVILAYVNDTYGDGRLAPEAGSDARAAHDEWLHYVESSAAFPIMMTRIGGWLGGLPEGLARFAGPEVTKALNYIASGLRAGPYLMGDDLTLADIQMSSLLALAEESGMLTDYPGLVAYLARLRARPALVKAIDVGGPMTTRRP